MDLDQKIFESEKRVLAAALTNRCPDALVLVSAFRELRKAVESHVGDQLDTKREFKAQCAEILSRHWDGDT